MTIKLNDEKNLKAFITLLYNFGYKHYKRHDLEKCIRNYEHTRYTYFTLDSDAKTFKGECSKNYLEYEHHLPEIIENLINPPKLIRISNVGDYEAVVGKTGVKVGCQTITPEKVEEIYKALQSLKH